MMEEMEGRKSSLYVAEEKCFKLVSRIEEMERSGKAKQEDLDQEQKSNILNRLRIEELEREVEKCKVINSSKGCGYCEEYLNHIARL